MARARRRSAARPRRCRSRRPRSRSCSATCTSTRRSRATPSWGASRSSRAKARIRSSDACDYARFCSSLDFWSINDHAEASTPRRWNETKDAIRQCNALAGDGAESRSRGVPRLGVEPGRSDAGRALRTQERGAARSRRRRRCRRAPIGAAGLATDALRNASGQIPRLLPFVDFRESPALLELPRVRGRDRGGAALRGGRPVEPAARRLLRVGGDARGPLPQAREWGSAAIVIPHGNTWGFYSPPGTTWDKQLVAAQHDPTRQILIEVMSGHGNSEEYRDWKEIEIAADGTIVPDAAARLSAELLARRRDHRGALQGRGHRRRRVRQARGRSAPDIYAHVRRRRPPHRVGRAGRGLARLRPVPRLQLPRLQLPPGRSTQYALAISNFDEPEEPKRFHFGFIGSSDNHQARPGTGYKEFARHGNTESTGARDAEWRERIDRRPHRRSRSPAHGPSTSTPDARRGLAARRGRAAGVVLHDGRARGGAQRRPLARRDLVRAPAQGGLRDERRPHPALVPSPERADRRRRRRRGADGRRGRDGRDAALRGARGRRPRAEAGLPGVPKRGAPRRAHRAALPGRVLQPERRAAGDHAHRGRAHPPAGAPGEPVRRADRRPVEGASLRPVASRLRRALRGSGLRARRGRDTRLLRARDRGAERRRSTPRPALRVRRRATA